MASPYLMLPLMDESNQNQETDRPTLSLYSLKDKKPYNLNLLENLENFQCVGSSHGWLGLLDENNNPFLLNPFSQTLIPLPPNQTLPHQQQTFPCKISKLILSKSPSPPPNPNPNNYAAVVIYTPLYDSKIAFCRHGDDTWSTLDCTGRTYYDVVCCDKTNTLFALGPGPLVESWDLNQTLPAKTIIIQDSCPRTLKLAGATFPTDLYSSRWYLALSPAREVVLIVRYVGEFVRYDGEVVYEGDTLTEEAAEPLVCPYRTVGFRVFRVDERERGREREWVDVESLDDLAVFLGGNESEMVAAAAAGKELKRNAIYFTDDYWESIDVDYSYGGHDMGVFSMEDGTIQQIFEFQQLKISPPPFWITNVVS